MRSPEYSSFHKCIGNYIDAQSGASQEKQIGYSQRRLKLAPDTSKCHLPNRLDDTPESIMHKMLPKPRYDAGCLDE